jgi:hypothetical protein
MVFTNQTLGRAACLSHGGNEAAHGAVVSVFNHQSSTEGRSGKAPLMGVSQQVRDRADWRTIQSGLDP